MDAAPPVIESFSLDQTVEQNAETTLSVVARSTDGGTLSYQWYRSETEGSTGGEQIEGATAPSYAPPTDIAGAYTYYCVVTNTNPKATGSKTASTTTPAVTVTVLEHSEDCNGGPDCPSYHFTDVDAGMWHHLYVDYVVSHQLMNGISETSFAPDSTLTRAMLAQILYNAEGAPASDRSADFGDVDSDAWYYKAIAFVSSEGLMGGYGDGQFGPDDFITREQLVTTLYRYAEKTGKPVTAAGDLTGFPDGASVSSWAQRAMEWAIGAELIFGRDDGTLDPTGTATRAEIAAVLMRYFTAA